MSRLRVMFAEWLRHSADAISPPPPAKATPDPAVLVREMNAYRRARETLWQSLDEIDRGPRAIEELVSRLTGRKINIGE